MKPEAGKVTKVFRPTGQWVLKEKKTAQWRSYCVVENVLPRVSHVYPVISRQPETLIGKIRCNNEPYPADPNWYDCAFDSDLPATEEANGIKESCQKEEHCRGERKGRCVMVNLAEKISSGMNR